MPAETAIDPGTWCPGCSQYRHSVCHLHNCAIGPNGLQARIDAHTATTTEAHPTMEFRFLQRGPRTVRQNQFGMGEEVQRPRVLQQRWAIITFRTGPEAMAKSYPISRETEWRDVPLVEE